MSQSHVVSFGALIVDALGRPVRGIPEGQQISFLDEIHVTAAGTAAATALDLGKLGVDVLAVGRVGDDALATFLGVALEKSGVDTSGLIVDADHQTSATILPIRVDGSRPALHVLGANSALREEDVPWNRVGPDTVFHFGGAFILPALDGDPTARVLRRAKELGAVTTLDMALSPRPDAADVIAPALPYTTCSPTSRRRDGSPGRRTARRSSGGSTTAGSAPPSSPSGRAGSRSPGAGATRSSCRPSTSRWSTPRGAETH
jgi:sugar/nucleoside kinase (ribokinase family)